MGVATDHLVPLKPRLDHLDAASSPLANLPKARKQTRGGDAGLPLEFMSPSLVENCEARASESRDKEATRMDPIVDREGRNCQAD